MYHFKKSSTIAICTSASFYKKALDIRDILLGRGFKVIIPHNASVMERTGDYNVSSYKIWYADPKYYKRKAYLMRKHFKEVEKADAILVINDKKKGISGYIGGNVLIEMSLAFHLNKPIYVLNPVAKSLSFYEEVMGMLPIILKGKIDKIKNV